MNEEKKLVPKLRFPEFKTEPGWGIQKVGDLLRETQRPIKLEDGADYCLVTVKRRYGGLVSRGNLKGREIKVSSQFLVNAGDFLISKRQIVHDACGLVPERLDGSVVSNEYSVLTAKPGCSIDFFNWFAQQPCVSASFLECSVGIVIEKMLFKLNLWLRREFLFPHLLEQQKIADCLSSVDELIAAQARKVDVLKTHKKWLMQQLFPREGETQPRLRFPEFQDAGEWEIKSIGDLEPFITSGSRGWAAFYAERGSLFVRITNLSRGSIYLDITDSKFVNLPPGANEGVRTQLKEHDVLISITADIGIVGYVDKRLSSPAYINQHIALVRFDASKLSGRFMAYFLASEKSERVFRASSDTGTKAGMSLSGVQKIPVMLPTLPEQDRIADCLTSLDDLITAQTQKLQALKTHKKGLMQQLFPSTEKVAA